MVSRRNFISITIMMLTLLFMFQTTQFYYEYAAEAERNEFIPDHVISGAQAWEPDVPDISDPDLDVQYVLFLGDENGAVGRTVKQWCTYTKRVMVACEDLNLFAGIVGKHQEYVLVESEYMDARSDLEKLTAFADAGVRIVFCDLPEAEEISKNPQLQQMLGIRKIQDEQVTVEGIRMFSGFLLGGEVIYQNQDEDSDLLQNEDLTMPWYQLLAGAQTYVVGILDEQEGVSREDLPALMWSYTDGTREIFAVNGDYLHDSTGVGILSAMDAKLSDYALYPILDAQLLTVANYPALADENAQVMQELFSCSMTQAGRDVLFPQLVATADQTGFLMSAMLQVQYDYQDENAPKAVVFKDYCKIMKQAGSEMGLSLTRKGDTTLEQKLTEDRNFLDAAQSAYLFGAVYASHDSIEDVLAAVSAMESVNTIVAVPNPDQDLIFFGNDRITVQSMTNDAGVYSFRTDLHMRSVQTALGYTNVLYDVSKVLWPGEEEESWEKLSKRYADNLYTGWSRFQDFEDVTVSQNDQKIRQLLTMDYNHVRKGDIIYLELEHTEQSVSFILRLHNMEPEYVAGGTCIKLEEGVYLIRTTGENIEIHLRSSNPIHN